MNVQFVLFDGNRDWAYVSQNAGVIACEDTCGITALDADTGQHLAAIVFDSFTHSSALAHIVVSNPIVLRHGFLEEAAGYIYIYRERLVLYGLVPANNEKALKLDKHIGFKEVTRLKDGYAAGIDYVLMEMHYTDCKWLEPYKQQDVKAIGG